MAYTLRRSDGTILLNIPDHSIDKSELPIALVGRGAVNYGTDFGQNFIHMLENFADHSAPARPMTGMLWYDTAEREMKLWTGTAWRLIVGNISTSPLPNTIVFRDADGNITANEFIGNLRGNADTASKWKTPRRLTLTGDATGSALMDGSEDVSLETTIERSASADHATTADKWTTPRRIRLTGNVDGEVMLDGSGDVSLNCTVTNITGDEVGTPDNVANKLVRRDAQGNFAATRITANLIGNVTGNADTASKLTVARSVSLQGHVTGAMTFDGSSDALIATTIVSIPDSALPATGVAAGSYSLASITVSTDGRITSASNGAIPTTGVTPGSYTTANITVGSDGRITAASNGASTGIPAHTHNLSDIVGLDNRINEVTNVSTIKGMRRVGGPNITYIYYLHVQGNATGQTPTYRTPAGAFVVGTFAIGSNYGCVGYTCTTTMTNYYVTEYIQYYINGSWVTIS